MHGPDSLPDSRHRQLPGADQSVGEHVRRARGQQRQDSQDAARRPQPDASDHIPPAAIHGREPDQAAAEAKEGSMNADAILSFAERINAIKAQARADMAVVIEEAKAA